MNAFLVTSFLIAAMFSYSAHGANISKINTGTNVSLIILNGAIERGDYERFLTATTDVASGAVLLRSKGGSLIEGIKIGREIRHRGYATGVAPNYACQSACALIWVGGSHRYMAPNALIGFHAAYVETPSGKREVGYGNALIGGYLRELGLSDDAIIFATRAGPDDFASLTIESARRAGISVNILRADSVIDPTANPLQSDSPIPLRLPSGFRWIVLASASQPHLLPVEDAQAVFGKRALTIVETRSGKYALVAGPFTQEFAERSASDLKAKKVIKTDAFLSSGNGFLSRSSE